MNRIDYMSWLPFFIATYLALAGCNSSSPSVAPGATVKTQHAKDHDHGSSDDDAHPESFAAAVQKIDSLRAALKDAFAANDMSKADGPVHEIAHILEEVAELAKKESLADADQETVKKAVDELFECFGKIDEKVHGGEGKSYEDLAERIDAALQTLRVKAKLQE